MIKHRKAFLDSPSILNLKKWVDEVHNEAQKNYNEAKDDHRYLQGRLTMAQELLKIVGEAAL